MIRFSIEIGATKYFYYAYSGQCGSEHPQYSYMPYICAIEDPARRISRDGQTECSDYAVIIRDEDRLLRNTLEAGTALIGCLTTLLTAYYTAYGWVRNVDELPEGRIKLTMKDIYGYALEKSYPLNTLTTSIFSHLPDFNIGKSFIYPYGIMNCWKEGFAEQKYKGAHGAYDCPCVDGRGLISGVNYNDYLVSSVAIKSIDCVYREQNGDWVALNSTQWSVDTATYSPHITVRVKPQTFKVEDTLKVATVIGQDHCHVNNIGWYKIGGKITIDGTATVYTITASDYVDKLTVTPNIVAVADAGDSVKGECPSSTLISDAAIGDNHIHVNDVSLFEIGDEIQIDNKQTLYKVKSNDGADKLELDPVIAEYARGEINDHLHQAATAGDAWVHVDNPEWYREGDQLIIDNDTDHIYTVTQLPHNPLFPYRLIISPVMQHDALIASDVFSAGSRVVCPSPTGQGPGKEKMRVDVHGVNGGAYGGAAAYENPAVARKHFLQNVIGISSAYFDTTTWASTGTESCEANCNAKSIKMAGVVDKVQTGIEWDREMGKSTMTETWINSNGKLCIRLYNPTWMSHYTFYVVRDCAKIHQPEYEQEIYTKIIAHYCYNGSDYYATEEYRISDIPTEMSFSFQWNKTAMIAVLTMLAKRYKAKTYLVAIQTSRAITGYDIGKQIKIESKQIIANPPTLATGRIFTITAIQQNGFNGVTTWEGQDIRNLI